MAFRDFAADRVKPTECTHADSPLNFPALSAVNQFSIGERRVMPQRIYVPISYRFTELNHPAVLSISHGLPSLMRVEMLQQMLK